MTERQVEICGYVPGALGRITELHGTYYHREWGFGLYFESLVATELAEFLGRLDPARDGLWLARLEGEVVGSIVIDGRLTPEEGARLRWFILAPEVSGRGLGRQLMGEAVSFCRRAGLRRVYLWTFAGLDAARHIYESAGFSLCKEHEDDQWGEPVTEQMFELWL